ncbi:MAG: hypothetical protein ABI333_12970 [bacterium]
MTRTELKEVICRVIDKMQQRDDDAPAAGCLFADTCDNCDVTTRYAIGEEG